MLAAVGSFKTCRRNIKVVITAFYAPLQTVYGISENSNPLEKGEKNMHNIRDKP